MRTGRPKAALVLTDDERRELESLAHRSRSAPAIARRARIVLACAEGRENKTVPRRLRMSPVTVCKWRARFVADRVAGLFDEPRVGAPRQIPDAKVEEVVIRTLETTPRGGTHWSTRGMAKAMGFSHMTINRVWRAFGLQPHRTETFKLSPDPQLIEKVRDIVGLYMNPPITPSCCASTRSPRFKPWIAARRCCRCGRAKRSDARTTISVMGPRRCLRRWTRRGAKSLPRCIVGNGRWNFASFWTASTRICRPTSTCTSSWTTTAPIKPP